MTAKIKGKLFIKTHGCQMNEYDSSKMHDVLHDTHELTLTENEDEADVILLNTCSIREKAQEKFFHNLAGGENLKTKIRTLSSGWADVSLHRKVRIF